MDTPSNQSSRVPRGRTVAVFFGASVGLVAIGLLNYLADASAKAKTFLTFSKALGPWSGKVSLGYLAGLGAWFLAWLILRNRDGNIVRWFWIFFFATGVAILFTYTPFREALLEL